MPSCYTNYAINECAQCGMLTNNLLFCDLLCWRIFQQYTQEEFRGNRMPEWFEGMPWDWHMSQEERESAAIYQLTESV